MDGFEIARLVVAGVIVCGYIFAWIWNWSKEAHCAYCHDGINILRIKYQDNDGVEALEIHIDGVGRSLEMRAPYRYGSKDINYCPMCGRRLR